MQRVNDWKVKLHCCWCKLVESMKVKNQSRLLRNQYDTKWLHSATRADMLTEESRAADGFDYFCCSTYVQNISSKDPSNPVAI